MQNEKGKLYFGLRLDNNQLQADAAESRNIIKGIGNSAVSEGERIDGAFRKVGGAVAAVFTVQQAAAFAKSIVQVRGEIESLEISFQTLLGNKQKADALFSEIRTFASNTPMQLNDLAKGAQMLLSFNIEAERVMPTLRQIGDIAMGDAQKFNALTLAFSQMSSTGKLMGQDLLQMINAGFNPLTIISEKTGKSIAQLKVDMAAGAISADMVANAFASATAEGGKFHGMLDKQSKGITGSISNLQGAIQDMFNDLGTANQDFITDAVQGATTVVQHYKEIGEALAVIIGIYGTYRAAIIATEAVRQTITTVQHTEEAAELYKLLSAEQQAQISKQGLSKSSAQYYALVKAETVANVQAVQTTLAKARAEVKAANETAAARRAEYVAAKQLEQQRLAELMSIGATGTAKQVEAAERKLAAAEIQRETAALSFQSATRDFNSKKTVVETAARSANTAATAVNTAAQTANTTATGFLTVAKTKLAAVAAKVNAVIMKNPFAIATAAVIALGYGLYKLITYQTDAEKSAKKLREAEEGLTGAIQMENAVLNIMFDRLNKAEVGTKKYADAKQSIIDKYNSYLSGMSKEQLMLMDSIELYNLLTEAIGKATRARLHEQFISEAATEAGENQAKALRRLREDIIKEKGEDVGDVIFAQIRDLMRGFDIEGNDYNKINEEIRDILNRSELSYKDVGGHKLTNRIHEYSMAASVLRKEVNEAEKIFGERQSEDSESGKNTFDTMTASLQQLMDRAPKAREELAALKKEEGTDPAAIAAKEQEIKLIEEQTLARERGLSTIKDVKAQIDALQKEQLNYAKDDEEYKALEDRIKALQAKLPLTAGQSSKAENDAARLARETAERNQKIGEYTESIKKEITQSELDIAQSRIDAMEEGFDKTQAQIELTYNKMIFANQQREADMVKALQDAREIEWENENPGAKAKGQIFDRSTVTAADLSPEQQATIAAYYAVAEEIRNKANRDSLETMLADVRTYEQQRLKIAEDYEKQRKALYNEDGTLRQGVTQGNVDELNRNEQEAIKAVDEEFAQREETYQAWMNTIANMTLEQLERVLERAENELAELESSGTADSQQLAVARAKVSTARNKVSQARAQDEVSPGKRSIKEWEDLYKTLREVESEFENIGDTVGGVAGDIISTAGQIASSTLSMVSSIAQLANWAVISTQMTAEGASKAIQTVEKASVILTVISAAMQIAMTIINLFNNDTKHQEEIERLQERIDQLQWELDNADIVRLQKNTEDGLTRVKRIYNETVQEVLMLHQETNKYSSAMYQFLGKIIHQNEILEKSVEKIAVAYANLSYTADKALGEEKFSSAKDQLKNIAEQQLLLQEQINSEDAKKKTDHGKISDWEQQIRELAEEANNIINEIVEEIIGGSAADIASELADAFIDAFQAGENAAEAWGDKVNDIVSNIVKNMLVSKYLEEPLGAIFDKYKAKWYQNGEFAGIDAIVESMSGFAADLNAVGDEFQMIWENLPDSVKNMFTVTSDSAREASEKGFAAASQDSITELNGRATAIQGHTYSIMENMRLLIANCSLILEHLAGIRDNTSHLAEIKEAVKSIKGSTDDMTTHGVTIKR